MIDHIFKSEIGTTEFTQLFRDCTTLDQYLENLRGIKSPISRFVHHGFETLIEAIVEYHGIILDHEVVTTSEAEETGVHGIGRNENDKCVVGVIYSAPEYSDRPLVAASGVTKFLNRARLKFNLTDKPKTYHLFSNAPAVHDRTIDQFITGQGLSDAVVLYMHNDIAKLIDGDEEFWAYIQNELHCDDKLPIPVKELRKFQRNAVKACKGQKRGRVVLPTGTGKTLIEAALIEEAIKSKRSSVCVISSPRIILTYQHIDEISEYLISRGIEAQYLNLNSGNLDEDRIKEMMMRQGMITRDIPSTTNPNDVNAAYKECQKSGLPLIIGATYHSFPKMGLTNVPIQLKIADEAHNIVSSIGRFSEEAKKDYHKVPAEQAIFATATQAFSPTDEGNTDEGDGMQNKKVFGPLLFRVTPKEMIDAGEIVPPYLHIAEITAGTIKKHQEKLKIEDVHDIDNPEVDAIVVMECFEKLKEQHEKYSADPEKMGTKMLVVFKGQQAFSYFFNSAMVQRWSLQNNIQLVGMTSDSGAYLNGERVLAQDRSFKEKFMCHLNTAPDSTQMIIGHIDMLGEGMNIPTLLGVLPLRDLGEIKSAQTLGRAMRLFGPDRRDFYEGRTKVGDREKMIKPFAWVIIPRYSWDHESGSQRLISMARAMKNDLGYNPFEMSSGVMGDGRNEVFQKDPRLPSDAVDALEIFHQIDNPEFLDRLENEKEAARKDPKVFQYWTKYGNKT